MKTLLLIAFAALTLSAQTLPTLPAFNSVVGTSVTCTFESQDAAGSTVFTQCTQPDGTVAASSVAIASDMGVVLGHAEVMCLYWAESAGKNRLQCGTAGKVVIDGYLPPVTRKKRWYLIWR